MINKLIIFVVPFALFIALASPTFAQQRGTELSLTGEFWNPEGGSDGAWGPGLGLSFPLGSSDFDLDLKASWFSDVGPDQLGDLAIVPVDLGVSWRRICHDWEFKLGAGGTWANANLDSEDGPGNADIDSAWGAYALGGVAYYLQKQTALLVDVGYRFIQFDVSSFANENIEGEIDADGIIVGVGFKYVFN